MGTPWLDLAGVPHRECSWCSLLEGSPVRRDPVPCGRLGAGPLWLAACGSRAAPLPLRPSPPGRARKAKSPPLRPCRWGGAAAETSGVAGLSSSVLPGRDPSPTRPSSRCVVRPHVSTDVWAGFGAAPCPPGTRAPCSGSGSLRSRPHLGLCSAAAMAPACCGQWRPEHLPREKPSPFRLSVHTAFPSPPSFSGHSRD